MNDSDNLEAEVARFGRMFNALKAEIQKAIVGMDDVVALTLASIFAGGHVLLEGVPGLGKTLLVKSVADTFGMSFKRIQFTPDLMPSDVTGTQVLSEDEKGRRSFTFKQGPLFANIVLADEINRATPKTQAALLEAMEERQITVLDETHTLPAPFFVLATQNPIELEGTYPLPEAQLDRFLIKILVAPPSSEQLKEILVRTTGTPGESPTAILEAGNASSTVRAMQDLVRKVVVASPLQDVLVRMIAALTPGNEFATANVSQYVRFGPGPRGAQAVLMLAKVHALLDQRINLSFDDIREALIPTLRHRLVLNFQAEADSVTSDMLIDEVSKAR